MLQSEALNILKTGRNVYLTGVAGSGKTHVLNEYISYLKSHSISPAVTASTGIAATHLGGVTIHSWSGVGIKNELNNIDIEELSQKEYLWKRFNNTEVLIIDEVSMLSPSIFDSLDNIAKAMRRRQEPFGGMQVVLSGDFFQLPPIIKGSEEVSFINESRVWRDIDLKICYLEEQHRQKGGRLESILNEMREGAVSSKSRSLIEEMKERKKEREKINPTRLFTHNADVDKLNDEELQKIKDKEYRFEMNAIGRKNLTESLKKGVLAPETLKLKKGAIVMFVKNNFEEGYVNGTLGVVEGFKDRYPLVKTFLGDVIHADDARWSIEEDGKTLASVEQLPLRLAWAITVHKSQGMSMDAAEMDLSKSFVPGQGYVALSRLRSLSGLFLLGINETAFLVNKKVLDFDKHLREESSKWKKVIGSFDREKVKEMKDDFIVKNGGTLKKVNLEEKKKKEIFKKLSTHQQTLELLEKGMSISEISKERELKEETIISHLEKLKEKGKLKGKFIKDIKPKKRDLENIKEAIEKVGDEKLKPIYEKLKGKYSYKDIKVARLFF